MMHLLKGKFSMLAIAALRKEAVGGLRIVCRIYKEWDMDLVLRLFFT
jgi:hypothetical protein